MDWLEGDWQELYDDTENMGWADVTDTCIAAARVLDSVKSRKKGIPNKHPEYGSLAEDIATLERHGII